ncbi:MAG: S1C family serine protease [Spirochaetaceae bacterium]|jgi:S1-C subfamily serine protease|nr:S1C family serine protease [Spirochaetaceae bacterium]
MKHKITDRVVFIHSLILCILLVSCASSAGETGDTSSLKPTAQYRIEDIEQTLDGEPARTLQLIGMYRHTYPDVSPADTALLSGYETQAVERLAAQQKEAFDEGRWEEAASLARSLKALNQYYTAIGKEDALPAIAGSEDAFDLHIAKEALAAKEYLKAFLYAIRSNKHKALGADDAILFLDEAYKQKQRRMTAYFLSLLQEEEAASIDNAAEIASYVKGKDSPADMIKGVATVLVDHGYKAQLGIAYREQMLGSAFFIDAAGYLITNYHVISSEVDSSYEGYSRMYIRMGNASAPRLRAKVIGYDKGLDLALIKAEVKPEYIFSVVDAAAPVIGDSVTAIGSPAGLEKTVTQGIISATGRRLLELGEVVQIDAALNPGNSGGPIVDGEGRLVGVAFAQVQNNPGLNFMIPIEMLIQALPSLIKGGGAERPWIGLCVQEQVDGLDVYYTAPLTPAADMQLNEGAVITGFNGQSHTLPDLQIESLSTRPGELVFVQTKTDHYLVQTVPRPSQPLLAASDVDSKNHLSAAFFGMILETAGKEGPFMQNYRVQRVIRGSIADDSGLSAGDPVRLHTFKVYQKEGYVELSLGVKKRSSGFLDTQLRLYASLDTPDTL